MLSIRCEPVAAVRIARAARCRGEIISTAVGNAHSGPGIANLLVVNHRIVERNIQPELRQVEVTDRGQQGIGGDDPIVLRGHERGACIHEHDNRIENIEGGALADPGFLAHAPEQPNERDLVPVKRIAN